MLSLIPPYLNLSSGLVYYILMFWKMIHCFSKPKSQNYHREVHSIKWITLVWGGYQGDFSLRSTWPRWLCLVNLPHPWGKFSTLLNQFYNPPGWPGVLPLGQADDMCITFHLFIWKIQLTVYMRTLTRLGGGRDNSGWASCLVSAGRVTLSGWTTFSHINTLARLPEARWLKLFTESAILSNM